MAPLIIFTHTEKTAGTSLLETVIKPNYSEDQIVDCGGFNDCMKKMKAKPDCRVVAGHIPYGLHVFLKRKVQYITILRDPVDRAVSHYYFVRESKYGDYKHPWYDHANSVSLTEFYRERQYQNRQTKCLAGYIATKAYNKFSAPKLEATILKMAMKNLADSYVCFGLQEQFEQSVQLFQQKFNWERAEKVERQKTTRGRPRIEDIDEETDRILRKYNQLDIQLYGFAVQEFKKRLSVSSS